MIWLRLGLGWLLCAASALTLIYAAHPAILLCLVILSGGFHLFWFQLVAITVPLGLCLGKLGLEMLRR
jgi:hypothetical protein